MKPLQERFLSLDVFRGMTLCFMIIVNTPGSGATAFGILEHAPWHGFTPTDLVFPSFLFAVGNAMSFSMKKFSQMDNSEVLLKIFKRSFLIFIIGYLMHWFPFFNYGEGGQILSKPFASTRIPGVLQRIALCFGIASLMIHYLSSKTVIWISIVFLAGYWCSLLLFGIPGAELSMTGNAGLLLDKFILGDAHLYKGEGIPFDPEGILSTIPAVVNVIIGYYAGKFIQEKGKGYESIAKLMLAGGLMVVIALIWHMVFPINKKLWSSSFVLVSCGIDLLLIGGLLYLIEIKQYIRWTRFFVVFGRNPLFIFILSGMLMKVVNTIFPNAHVFKWINVHFYQVIAPGAMGSLLFALSFMLVCWLVGLFLDRKKIYIRV